MSETKINLNQRVKVRLTSDGMRVYLEYLHRLQNNGVPAKFLKVPQVDEAGYWSNWTLWELMQIFGSTVDFGTEPFESDVIVLSHDHGSTPADIHTKGWPE